LPWKRWLLLLSINLICKNIQTHMCTKGKQPFLSLSLFSVKINSGQQTINLFSKTKQISNDLWAETLHHFSYLIVSRLRYFLCFSSPPLFEK
jgi:hypothetical protein